VDPALARVCLLDGFALHRADGRGRASSLRPLPRGVQRLLAFLALSGRPARSAVAGQLWPEVGQGQADGNLRSALWRVQKHVPGLVDSSGGALALAEGVTVDVRELSSWAERVLDAGPGAADLPDLGAIPEAMWRAELLPGWYDDWVLVERERLRQLRGYALERLADTCGQAGRYAAAVQAAYAAMRADPLRETAHRTLIRVHLAEGNAAEAIRAYECYRDLLAGELGISPSARMRRLVDEVATSGRPAPAG
jgi:DNA-binding SARP family transcriptional activator